MLKLCAMVAVLAASAMAPVLAQDCEPQWAKGVFSLRGSDRPVRDMIVWDSGSGPRLYVGGQFTVAADAVGPAIVAFDGQDWSGLDGGVVGSYAVVNALEVFDDGSGEALFVGGDFDSAGGQLTGGIARWDGQEWAPVGGSVAGGPYPRVRSLAVFDDGTGPALYAAGFFTSINPAGSSITVNSVARWDGDSWSALVGPDGTPGVVGGGVNALAVHDDGSGPALYVAGDFNSAGGELVNNIARWNGREWSRVYLGTNGPIAKLAVYDAGDGAGLYAGGSFAVASGVVANNLVRWDGSRWRAVTGPSGDGVTGYTDPVQMLEVVDAGDGPVLLVGGQFRTAGGLDASSIAQWDGAQWSAFDTGLGGRGVITAARASAVFDAGDGARLFVGGYFDRAGAIGVENMAQWDGDQWLPILQLGGAGLPREGQAITVFDGGSGPGLYVAGEFEAIDGVTMNGIARWDGEAWSPVGGGIGDVSTGSQLVRTMAAFDDGSGPALYVGGGMLASRGAPASYLARWDGSAWSSVGTLLNGEVVAMQVVDAPGLEPGLYIGGAFTHAPMGALNGVARWDGSAFHPVGGGIHTGVAALALHDDGTGVALYAAASTGSGSAGEHHVFRWDGNTWETIDEGFEDRVLTLASFDDGSGPALYAAGSFTHASLAPAERIARWDGSVWTPFGPGMVYGFPRIDALTVGDAGDGPMLYAGGQFEFAGGQLANGIARWDGLAWQAMQAPGGSPGVGAIVRGDVAGLAWHDDGSGPAIFAVGDFTNVGGVASSGIARWGCAPEPCRADFDGDGDLTIFDFLAFQNAFDAGDLAADFDGDGSLTILDFLAFQNEYLDGCG